MTVIQKWGNSLGVRFNKETASKANLKAGTVVKTEPLEDGTGVIVRLAEPKPTLDELLARITPENRHYGVDLGETPQGRELI